MKKYNEYQTYLNCCANEINNILDTEGSISLFKIYEIIGIYVHPSEKDRFVKIGFTYLPVSEDGYINIEDWGL